MSRISDEELRRIAAEATPGPWSANGGTIWAAGYMGREINIASAHRRGPTTQMAPNAALIALAPALAAEVLQLREALKPFAETDKYYDSSFGDDYAPRWAEFFTIGDFRRARVALSPAPVVDAVKQGDAQ